MDRVWIGAPVNKAGAPFIKEWLESIKRFIGPQFCVCLVDDTPDAAFMDELAGWFKGFGNSFVLKHLDTGNNAKGIVDGDRSKIRAEAILACRKYAIELFKASPAYTHFFSLETDMFHQPEDMYKMIRYSRANGRPIVSSLWIPSQTCPSNCVRELYFKKDKWTLAEAVASHIRPEEIKAPMKVASCGLGSVLFNRTALEMVDIRIDPRLGYQDDMAWHIDAEERGLDIWIMDDIRPEHWRMIDGQKVVLKA